MAPGSPPQPSRRRSLCSATAPVTGCSDAYPCESCCRADAAQIYRGYVTTYDATYINATTDGNSAYEDNEEKLLKAAKAKAHFDAFIGRGPRRRR